MVVRCVVVVDGGAVVAAGSSLAVVAGGFGSVVRMENSGVGVASCLRASSLDESSLSGLVPVLKATSSAATHARTATNKVTSHGVLVVKGV